MTELEITLVPSLVNYLQNWKRFLDDTFVFALPDKLGYTLNQLNSFGEKNRFTFEMEEEIKLAFPDVMAIRNTNDTFNTTFYRKPTTQTFKLTGIHIHQYRG